MKRSALTGFITVILMFSAVRIVSAADAWFVDAGLGASQTISDSWQWSGDISYFTGADWAIKDFYLQYQRNDFTAKIGRADLNWGPAEDSLILDDHQGYDMLDLAGEWKLLGMPIHWEQFWANLNERAGSPRRLFGHRYEVAFGRLTLGGAETVVLSGDYNRCYYLPLIPYYGIQHLVLKNKTGSNRESNILVQFDFEWKQDDGLRLYGAAMIDDAPTTQPNDDVPGRVGIQFGFDKPELIGIWGLRGEYTGITRYTYTYLAEAGDYTGPDLLIGHPLGPDADRWRIECFRSLDEGWGLAIRIEQERHGEGRFGDRWTLADGGGYHFLEGIVETDQRLAVQLEKRWGMENSVKLLLGYEWIDHAGNVDGLTDHGFYGEIGVKLRL